MPRTWTPRLAIGVPSIDRQHQELFRRSDDLLEALSRGEAQAELAKLIDFLEQYVATHFGAEERLMIARKYPEVIRHQLLHQQFSRELASIRVELDKRAASTALVLRLNQLMSGWLVNHISVEDTKIAAFLGNDGQSVTL